MDVRCPVEGAQQRAAVVSLLRFDLVCRVCGKEDENSIHIFGDDGLNHELALKMNTYLPIKVADGDGMPSNCCWNCASSIISWHELVAASADTDRKLKELLAAVAEPLVVRTVSPKVEVEPELVLPNLDIAVVKEEGEGSVDFRETIIIKEEDEDATGAASRVRRKVEVSKRNETTDLESSEKPTCDLCCKSFSSNSTLFRHKRTFHKGIVSHITCNVCNKTFTENRSLMRHKRNLHATERTYTCKTCGEEFAEKTDYFSHVRGVHYNIARPGGPVPDENLAKFFCNVCNSGYVRKRDLVRHTRTKHLKCGDPSAKRASLAKYKLVIDDEVLYECDVCKKRYGEPYAFSVHRQVHIKGSHACDICGKRYATNSSLRRHHNQNHTAKRFTCKVCGAQFRARFWLAQHVNIHSDKRPYTCEVCGKAFRQASTLSVHKRCHGDFRYSCDVCGKGFRRRCYLKEHMTQHTRPGSYGCNLCGKSFRLYKMLQQHVNNHDPLATDSCDVQPAEVLERSQGES